MFHNIMEQTQKVFAVFSLFTLFGFTTYFCCCRKKKFCACVVKKQTNCDLHKMDFVSENENFIDQLPVEMIMNIFSCLPNYYNVSLVNKQFYDVACKMNDRNVSLTLDDKFFEKWNYPELLSSIQKSNREITYVRCQLDPMNKRRAQLQAAISIVKKIWLTMKFSEIKVEPRLPATIKTIKKFSATIKTLELSSTSVETSTILEILSLVPNLENLHFNNLKFRPSNKQPFSGQKEDNDLNLHHLKALRVDGFKTELSFVLNRLPVGIFTKYKFYGSAAALNVLLKRVTYIRYVKLDDWTPVESLDSLSFRLLDSYRGEWIRKPVKL